MADGKMPPALAKKLGKTTEKDDEEMEENEEKEKSDSPSKKKFNPLMEWAKKKAG